MLHIANEMKHANTHTGRRRGVAAAFVEDRLAEGRAAFAVSELAAATGLSAMAANNQLKRLGDRVTRVSRAQPFFVIVPPSHRAIGAPPLEWWLDAYFRWLGHPYYLALLSAAESHGAAPQAVQVHQVMTDTPRREVSVGRVRVRFFVKQAIERTPVAQPAGAYAPLRVSTPEATVLDLVTYAPRLGGIGRVCETLVPLLPSLRFPALRRALDAEQNTATAQRFGYLLERCDAERLADVVHEWLPPRPAWRVLRPAQADASKPRRVERWRVLVKEGDLA